MADQDDDQIECGVCFETNVLEDLTCCKGSICESCLDAIKMRDPNPICPFCRQNIDKENYQREESTTKIARADPDLYAWLERQAKATPGVRTREALIMRKFIMTMRPGIEDPPNFDYLFVGYFRTISDLWDSYDKLAEFNRLKDFTATLDNYQPFYQVLAAKQNSTRLFPDHEVVEVKQPYTLKANKVIVTRPSAGVTMRKKPLPPPLNGRKPKMMPSLSSSSRDKNIVTKPSRSSKPLPPSSSGSSRQHRDLFNKSKGKEEESESDFDEEEEEY